ncbi:YdbL family protein [Methyloversatilis sp.]|uniref:YdbL family protein n=1 Tax=Methyloversatilis sp. TaxID=2569862 RepID=UPI0027366892|nr:YdbL family protein [Methyloversatilis sp.]MDP2868532.1 YdbL family protein [Methyloversatilis sp.]MDP3287418.1 YdbL family protein [Methyloversatilis sp.]MDP3455914.1 YdbL family protein [Methyloversatilis sp.]MDP3577677.1 YdbL family protein [Methyloversatilis sp.]
MKTVHRIVLLCLLYAGAVWAQGNLEINTPAISQLRDAMQARHAQLAPHYASGALGLTADGRIALRDANVVPLAQRQTVQGLVAQENGDRDALYREIARANGHPEWEADIRSTFAQRWIGRAQSGWYVQSGGQWSRK